MKLNTWPARRGLDWVRMGLRTFFRQPLALGGLFFMFFAVLSVVGLLPVIGVLLALALMPALTAGMMRASEVADQGLFPMPRVLFAGLLEPSQRASFGVLGFAYLACIGALMLLTWAIDGGQFVQVYTGQAKIDTLLQSDQGATAMVAFLMGYLPVSMAFWHAPALVHWHGVSPLKALFFSFVGCWRNVGAMAVYIGGWMAAMMGALSVVGTLSLLLGAPSVAAVAGGPLALLIAAMFFVSFFFTARDTFDAGAAPLNAPPNDSSPGAQP